MSTIPTHVNGSARIDIQFRDLFGGLQSRYILGFTSQDGVNIENRIGTFEWTTDQSGSHIPGAILTLGTFSEITMELIRWRQIILDQLLAVSSAGFGNVGFSNTNNIGRTIFSGQALDRGQQVPGINRTATLFINSEKLTELSQEPYHRWDSVLPVDIQSYRLGKRITRMTLKVKGIPQDQKFFGNTYQKVGRPVG